MGGFKFKPLFNFSKWISEPVFCDPICYTLKQLQNPLQKLPAAEKDTKNSRVCCCNVIFVYLFNHADQWVIQNVMSFIINVASFE